MGFTIRLIRHAQTDFNVHHLLVSANDEGINDNGIVQATKLGKALKNDTFTRVYSSDLRRCQDTTKCVLAQLQTEFPEIILDERLRERGMCRPRDKGSSQQSLDPITQAAGSRLQGIINPGGESAQETRERVVQFFDELFEKADNAKTAENILIFSHCILIQTFLMHLKAYKELYDLENCIFDPWKFATNTAVTKFSVERRCGNGARRRLVFHAVHDDSHLTA